MNGARLTALAIAALAGDPNARDNLLAVSEPLLRAATAIRNLADHSTPELAIPAVDGRRVTGLRVAFASLEGIAARLETRGVVPPPALALVSGAAQGSAPAWQDGRSLWT